MDRYNRGHTGAEEKDFTGRKAKGSSEKPSRRDYQPLFSIKTSASSLPPYEKFTPILKRKAANARKPLLVGFQTYPSRPGGKESTKPLTNRAYSVPKITSTY